MTRDLQVAWPLTPLRLHDAAPDDAADVSIANGALFKVSSGLIQWPMNRGGQGEGLGDHQWNLGVLAYPPGVYSASEEKAGFGFDGVGSRIGGNAN